jgi:hypothetical protein
MIQEGDVNIEQLNSVACRVGFFAGFVLLALAVLEELARMVDFTLVGQAYTTDTFLHVGGILFVVVIALLLRQVREELKKRSG